MILEYIAHRNCIISFSKYNLIDDPIFRQNCPKQLPFFTYNYDRPTDLVDVIVSFDKQVDIKACFITTNQVQIQTLEHPLNNYHTKIYYSNDLFNWTEFPIRQFGTTFYKLMYYKDGAPFYLRAYTYNDLFTNSNSVITLDLDLVKINRYAVVTKHIDEDLKWNLNSTLIDLLNNWSVNEKDIYGNPIPWKPEYSPYRSWIISKLRTGLSWLEIQQIMADNSEMENMIAYGSYVFQQNSNYIFDKKVQYLKYSIINPAIDLYSPLRITSLQAFGEVGYKIPFSLLSFRTSDFFRGKQYEYNPFMPSVVTTFCENLERNTITANKYPNNLTLGIKIK
jgi:hypothetical protein